MDRFKIVDGVYVYFVTFTIIDWLPIFINPEPTQILMDSMRYCIREKGLRINAYVIMPNHLHMIVFDRMFDNTRLQQALADLRKYTGRRLADYVDDNLPETLAKVIHRNDLADRDRQIWQPCWHAEGLLNEHFWKEKMDYIHQNLVRKGYVQLPEHWRYSSAGYWLKQEVGDVPVVPIQSEENEEECHEHR
jgi:REP element-mobilizing transposase RayT